MWGDPCMAVANSLSCRLSFRTAAISCVALLLTNHSGAQGPGWRGLKRDGHDTTLRLPDPLPKELGEVWRVDAGEGTAAPVVERGAIYLFSRMDGQESLSRFDFNGKLIWRRGYKTKFEFRPNSQALPVGIGPLAAPCVSGQTVVTQGIAGTVTAWDTNTGQQRWQKTYQDRFKKTWPEYGASVSPLITGDLVYTHAGTDNRGVFQAIELDGGERFDGGKRFDGGDVRWEWDQDPPGYAPPVHMVIDGTEQIVTATYRNVVSFDPKKGDVLWRVSFSVGEGLAVPTPTLVGNRVLVGGHRTPVTALLVRREREGWSAKIDWEGERTEMYLSSPVIVGDRIYGFSDRRKGQFICLDPLDGSSVWAGPSKRGENALLLAVGDKIMATTTEGECIVFRTGTDQFEPIANYQISDSPVWCPVVPIDLNRFAVRTRDQLILYSLAPENTAD